MVWFLSKRYFPDMVFLSNENDYWILGGFGSLSLLTSILVHELGHATAAKVLHIPIERIHVYLFGGMAELRHRPFVATQEFFVSLAGPVASAALSLSAFSMIQLLNSENSPILYFSFHFVAFINVFLFLFNLIPVFPLDGGRAVRALIWRKKHNFYQASALMHRLSSLFIALFFIISLVLFFFYDGRVSFWFGIFSLYTAYLLMKAKSELTHKPDFSNLIYEMDSNLTPAEISEKLLDINPETLNKSVIPVFVNQEFSGVLLGRDITKTLDGTHSLTDLIKKPALGCYIETHDNQTFNYDVEYHSDFLPIFESGKFVGLCDAFEMRFWLNQR